MALSRYTTFVAGAKLAAASLEGEFDNIIDALNATDNAAISITYNNSDVATLTLNNTGSGKPLSAKIGGVEKFYISATHGQIASTVPTGQPPLIVASTTKVENLNADQLDGNEASNLAKLDADNTFTQSGSDTVMTLDSDQGTSLIMRDNDLAAPGEYFRLRHLSNVSYLDVSENGTVWTHVLRVNGATSKAQVDSAVDADDWQNIASEDYVDAKLTTVAFGAFYEGALATATKQPRFIVPANIETGKILKLEATYQSGTVTDDSIIYLRHYNSSGVEDASSPYTLTLGSGLATGTVVSVDITDITLAAGDQLAWEVNTASGHAEVTAWAHGTQEVI
jgi:hypothetical protein